MKICIECAIRYHDFREALNSSPGDIMSNERAFPEAWIDGRRHRLGLAAPHHAECEQCQRQTGSLFVPADRS